MLNGRDYGAKRSWVSTVALPRMCCVTLGRHSTSLSLSCLNCTLDIMIFTYLRVAVRTEKDKAYKVLSSSPGTQSVLNSCELLPLGFEFRVAWSDRVSVGWTQTHLVSAPVRSVLPHSYGPPKLPKGHASPFLTTTSPPQHQEGVRGVRSGMHSHPHPLFRSLPLAEIGSVNSSG